MVATALQCDTVNKLARWKGLCLDMELISGSIHYIHFVDYVFQRARACRQSRCTTNASRSCKSETGCAAHQSWRSVRAMPQTSLDNHRSCVSLASLANLVCV